MIESHMISSITGKVVAASHWTGQYTQEQIESEKLIPMPESNAKLRSASEDPIARAHQNNKKVPPLNSHGTSSSKFAKY